MQSKAKEDLHETWMAETRDNAEKAFDHFLEKYEAKYPAACQCLKQDRDVSWSFTISRPSTANIFVQRKRSNGVNLRKMVCFSVIAR